VDKTVTWYRVVQGDPPDNSGGSSTSAEWHALSECRFCGDLVNDPREAARFSYHVLEKMSEDEVVVASLEGRL
jgi:hypothetical protein